jgi:hypothetical protein
MELRKNAVRIVLMDKHIVNHVFLLVTAFP